MRAYLAVTGIVFALVLVAHLARTAEVLTHLADDPVFVVLYTALTLGCGALAVWAWRLYRGLPRR